MEGKTCLLLRVVWWLDTNVTEGRAVSIFRVEITLHRF